MILILELSAMRKKKEKCDVAIAPQAAETPLTQLIDRLTAWAAGAAQSIG